MKNTVPGNINAVKTLDDILKDIFKNKKKQKDLDFDNVLEKIQGRNQSVMGPLSKLWLAVKSAMLSQEDSGELDLMEIQEFVKQIIPLLGQASNFTSYYKRFYMLMALKISPQKSKQMLWEDSQLLQKNDNTLFGKTFGENIWQTFKSKEQTLEMLS